MRCRDHQRAVPGILEAMARDDTWYHYFLDALHFSSLLPSFSSFVPSLSVSISLSSLILLLLTFKNYSKKLHLKILLPDSGCDFNAFTVLRT
jgi:hypothetical protein